MDEQHPSHNLDDDAAAQPGRSRAPRANPSRQDQVEMPDQVRITDYLKILYKRRWLAMTAFLVILVGTMVYTFTATPIYEAKTRLLIEAEDLNVVNFKSVLDEQQAKADYYTTQYNILQSRTLARDTLDQLKYWNTPPFGGDQKPAGFSVGRSLSAATQWVTGLFSSKPAVAVDAAAGETADKSRAIDTFLKHLSIAPIRNSRLVDVSYDLPDGAMATNIANRIATNYIAQDLRNKTGASDQAVAWLKQQVPERKKDVEEAEQALQDYREQNGAISLTDRENIVVQKLTQLNAEVTKAKTDRIQQEAMYAQFQQRQNDRAALETFPAILTNTFIQQEKGVLSDLLRQQAQLAESYGDKNEKMIKIKSQIEGEQAKLDAEIQKVVQSVKTEYQAAVTREKDLVRALDDQKKEALAMNSKAIEYNVLQRDVDSKKQIYDSLNQRLREAEVSGSGSNPSDPPKADSTQPGGVLPSSRPSSIRVVDAAEQPRSPVSPNRTLNLLAAVFGGGLFAVGLVFLFERMDDRLKTPDEITHFLGLPHLGLLPLVPKSETSVYPLLGKTVPANFSEAFRVIRTNVLFSSADPGGQSVLVTSTGPGEGKSLVAANLAISLAQTGKRVLLLDADLRKPMVHQVFDLSQEPGLSNYLVGSAKASEAVRKSFVEGLWLMSAGRLPPNPAELLGSERCVSLLQSLREHHFDWVVVDSPPVMAVADSSIIAHAVSGVVFVVGADMTSRHAASRAVDQLEGTQAKFFGAVLNRADLERNAYYYSHYYRREYGEYYQKAANE